MLEEMVDWPKFTEWICGGDGRRQLGIMVLMMESSGKHEFLLHIV